MKVYMVIVDGDDGGSWLKDRQLAEKLAQEVGGRVVEVSAPNKHDQVFQVEIRDGDYEYGQTVLAKVYPFQDPEEVAEAIAAFYGMDPKEKIGHISYWGDTWEERGSYRHISATSSYLYPPEKLSPTSAQIHWARVAKRPADTDPAEVYGPVTPVVLCHPSKSSDLPRRTTVYVSTLIPEGDRHCVAKQFYGYEYRKAFG